MLKIPLKQALKTTSHHLRRLSELGIKTLEDFLLYFPRRYTDQREVRPIIEIIIDEINTVRGTLRSIATTKTWKRRMSITTALLSDSSASVEIVWFNQPFIERNLKAGVEIILSGKAKYDIKKGRIIFQNPAYEIIKSHQIHTARIVPVYHETDLRAAKSVRGRISSKWIREKLFPVLPFAKEFPDVLPEDIRKQFRLIHYSEAVKNIHFPRSENALNAAKRRLSFEELFLLQLAALKRRYDLRKIGVAAKKQIQPDWELIKKFSASLPWQLTNAQKKAIYEILMDMSRPFSMSRLLQGDVGSGKTAVAAAAILQASHCGWQTCLMAPTEILARQHMATLTKFLSQFSITSRLLVGSTPKREKKSILEELKNGVLQCVVGTHALIQEYISFANLGLAIIDEQHRFGVRQREIMKTYNAPHILILTATPIPRTLALVLYGDQDLSILDEMPPGRQKILTRIVAEEKRHDAYRWIEKEIGQGRQAFIIFPLIHESEILQIKAATQEFERLRMQVFPKLQLGLLHGQMTALEKQSTMDAFRKGQIQILVSTAVVEVGVDVPNATIMMIEGAERFGLAQLHQFRGRVGRGSEKSYCFLFPSSYSPQTLKRLQALAKYDCGFKLAEIDLDMRGPGEIYGTAQSGIPDLKMASLSDSITIKQAREAAEIVLKTDPELLAHKTLKEKIAEQHTKHDE